MWLLQVKRDRLSYCPVKEAASSWDVSSKPALPLTPSHTFLQWGCLTWRSCTPARIHYDDGRIQVRRPATILVKDHRRRPAAVGFHSCEPARMRSAARSCALILLLVLLAQGSRTIAPGTEFGQSTQRCFATTPSGRICHVVPQQPARKAKQDLTPSLHENAFALPGTHQTACSEERNVGLIGQFLIPDVKLNASCNFLANSVDQVSQYLSKPMRRGIAGQRGVSGPISCQIIKRD